MIGYPPAWAGAHVADWQSRALELGWPEPTITEEGDLGGPLGELERALLATRRERAEKGRELYSAVGRPLVVLAVRGAFRWAVSRELLEADPFEGRAPIRTPRRRARRTVPTPAHVLAVAEWLEEHGELGGALVLRQLGEFRVCVERRDGEDGAWEEVASRRFVVSDAKHPLFPTRV